MEHDQSDTEASSTPDAGGAADNSPASGDEALTAAGAALSDAVTALLRVAARQGRQRLGKAAAQGRHRMEVRQLKKDRTRMVEKLGREVIRLVEGGELDHPGLLRGVERIRQQDVRIEEAEKKAPTQGSEPVSAPAEEDEQKIVDPSEATE